MITIQPQKAIVFRTSISRRTIKTVPLWELWLEDAIKLCFDSRNILPHKHGIRVPTFLSFTLSSNVPAYVGMAIADDYFLELAQELKITILNSYLTV